MTSAVAVDADDLVIPLIDFSTFLSGPPSQRAATAAQVLQGFQRAGFIYLTDHGIAPEAVSRAFALSAAFFRRPQAEKDSMEWAGPESNRGYTCMGREKTTQLTDRADVEALRASNPDLKESFEIGREGQPGCPNFWPSSGPDAELFRREMTSFFALCKELHVQLMRAVALGLGIDEHWFDDFTKDGDNTLRLLHYPAVRREVFARNSGQVRAGAHSDYGSVTLLFQDSRGGLQVQSPRGTFVDATPVEGAIVVNAGDLLARWSNDKIKSTVHRVVEPPLAAPAPEEQGDEHPARYSMAYFCNPDFEKMIEVIPGTIRNGEAKKYESVNSGVYLAQRLAATY